MTNAELVALATKLGEEKQASIDLLKTLNPDLFSQKQPCKPFEILLAGREEVKRDLTTFAPDPSGAKELTFVLLSRPSPAAIATGKIFVSDYMNASFEIAGGMRIITAKDAVDGLEIGDIVFDGSKKPQSGVIFASDQQNLFNLCLKCIREKLYVPAGVNAKKEALIKLKAKTFGLVVVLNVPPYQPHSWVDNKPIGLMSTRRDPYTGAYDQEPTIMSDVTFFVDKSDIDRLETIALGQYARRVKPYICDKDFAVKVSSNIGSGKTIIEITGKEPLPTGGTAPDQDTGYANSHFDDAGNIVDNDSGDIMMSAELVELEKAEKALADKKALLKK